jgi:flagella basal body P-ring formation protein FlgA
MTRATIRRSIFGPVVLLALGTIAQAQTLASLEPARPKLKSEAVVTGAIVRIGDLIEHAGVVSRVPIFRAPDLGSAGTVSAETVIEAVRAHALVGLDSAGVEEIVVKRATRTIEPREIEASLAAALTGQFALGAPRDLEMKFDRGLRPLHVEPTAKGEPRVVHVSYEPRSARFDALLDIPGHASLRLTGTAQAMVDVVMLAQPLKRGDIVKQADVVLERRARSELGLDVLTDRDHAIGLAVRTGMRPGRPLRGADLIKPDVVQRNETVTLVYEAPGITLTVRGRAAESGALGDVINVHNGQSKRTVQGVVIGPGRVVISTLGRQLAANVAPAGAGNR